MDYVDHALSVAIKDFGAMALMNKVDIRGDKETAETVRG